MLPSPPGGWLGLFHNRSRVNVFVCVFSVGRKLYGNHHGRHLPPLAATVRLCVYLVCVISGGVCLDLVWGMFGQCGIKETLMGPKKP